MLNIVVRKVTGRFYEVKCELSMIHDHALTISNEKQPTSAYTHTSIYCNINSVACYMLRPPIVAILREEFFEGYCYRPLHLRTGVQLIAYCPSLSSVNLADFFHGNLHERSLQGQRPTTPAATRNQHTHTWFMGFYLADFYC